MHHNDAKKHKAALSIKKAQGTITKILKMIDEDKYCPEIIQQVDAVVGLLKSSKKNLLLGHLDHCLEDKLKENKQTAIDELVIIFYLK
jgi:CsoR family transcriptional regulator, copper-sensing transcriptional repressor